MRLVVICCFSWMMAALDCLATPEVSEISKNSWLALVRRLRSVASIEPCRHGSVGRQTEPPYRCICESIFTGDRCQRLNMTLIGQVVLGGTVILHWDRPPRLHGYSVIYQEAVNGSGPSSGSVLHKSPIVMRDDSRSLLLDNLRGGGTPYWVCIEEEAVADETVATQMTDKLTNCLHVSTLPDYDSLAGWALALALSAITVLLIYLQRDKIELLYFSRPMTGYYEPVQQNPQQSSPEPESVASQQRLPRNPPTILGARP